MALRKKRSLTIRQSLLIRNENKGYKRIFCPSLPIGNISASFDVSLISTDITDGLQSLIMITIFDLTLNY